MRTTGLSQSPASQTVTPIAERPIPTAIVD